MPRLLAVILAAEFTAACRNRWQLYFNIENEKQKEEKDVVDCASAWERVESIVDAQTMAALSHNPAVRSAGADLGNVRARDAPSARFCASGTLPKSLLLRQGKKGEKN